MMTILLAALLHGAALGPCVLPDLMPAPSESMAGEGEGDADWCLEGTDPFGGGDPGVAPIQFLVEDEDLDMATLIQWRSGDADPVPAGWKPLFALAPTGTQAGAFREVLVQRFGDNLITITVNPAWRIGNAVCVGEGGPMTGYLPAGSELDAADRRAIAELIAPEVDDGTPIGRDPGNIMCTLLTADGDAYRSSYHGPGGRPLPEINEYYAGLRWHRLPPDTFAKALTLNR